MAINPRTGEIESWLGDYIEAPTMELAQEWCDKNKGYLKVVGKLNCEVPLNENKIIDYDLISKN